MRPNPPMSNILFRLYIICVMREGGGGLNTLWIFDSIIRNEKRDPCYALQLFTEGQKSVRVLQDFDLRESAYLQN